MEKPLEGRTILVTGGSKSIGLTVVLDLHLAGADVFVGTRSQENYFQVLKALHQDNPLFDGERVHPFITDISQPDQINSALHNLRNHDYMLTDIVHAAAGGMELFLPRLLSKLARLRRVPKQEQEVAFREFVEESDRLVLENQQFAQAVNFDGPRYLVESLKADLPEGANFVYESSLWTTFLDQVWVPRFYRGVASTKKMFEVWLESESGLDDKGIRTTIISGNVVADTDIGKAVEHFIASLIEGGQRNVMQQTFITRQDMVNATIEALEGSHFSPTQLHRRLFVFGPGGQITTELSPKSPVFAMTLPI